MAEKKLSLNPAVYDAVLDLQGRLQEVYGEGVTISDTIDFLGHQFFVHQRLLDIASIQLQKMAEERIDPSLLDKLLGVIGLNMPGDATCFIKTDIQVPLHWISTRWIIDIEGKNVIKCLWETDMPEKPMAKPKKKTGEFKIDVK